MRIVLGGSGSGKSTIINLILGLIKPDAGLIFVDGTEITKLDDMELTRIRKNIGMVFQEGALFDSLSVYDNVAYRLHEARIDEEEVETIRLVYGKLAKREIERAEIDKEVDVAKREGRSLRQYLSSVVGNLNDAGKEMVVRTAFFVAAADGKITDEETALMAELASALEMTPAHFKGVVDGLLVDGPAS
jgi:ABC-type sugar transport system ATPase subunit